jgi:peptidoglycan/LPS O-acetylase OafA/YrhL
MEGKTSHRDHSLDGIRGLAAVAVLAFHAWLFAESHSTLLRDNWYDWIFAELSLALYLFFVLSAYLMFRPFVRRTGGDRAWQGTRTYVRKRVVRIVPAYYFSLVGAIVLLYSGSDRLGNHLPPAGDLWLFFVFGQSYSQDTVLKLNPATWTLVVEVAFYLFVPFIGIWLARTRERLGQALWLVGAMTVIGFVWNWWTLGESAVWRLALPGMLPYFGFGLFAAVVVEWMQRRREDAGDEVVPLSTGAGRWLMAAGLGLVAVDVLLRELYLRAELMDVMRATIAGLGFAVIIVAATVGRAGARALSGRVVVWLGAVSYGVFLWQIPLMLAARDRGWLPETAFAAFVPALIASLILAVISLRVVEHPVERWAARRRRPADAS